jgi:CheY-like chemotaxis protein
VRTTILVAESDYSLRALIGWCLLARGYRVLTAEDGLEAVDRALSNRPDLIIANADLTVPAVEAGSFLAYIAGDPRICEIPVLATVDSDGMDPPAARTLPKPFDEGKLLRAVEGIIGPNRATPPGGIYPLSDTEEVTPVVHLTWDPAEEPTAS